MIDPIDPHGDSAFDASSDLRRDSSRPRIGLNAKRLQHVRAKIESRRDNVATIIAYATIEENCARTGRNLSLVDLNQLIEKINCCIFAEMIESRWVA